MASITTVSGAQIVLDPSAISAVAETDPDSGAAVTCLYGVLPAVVKVAGKAGDLLSELGLQGKFAPLTRPDGGKIWIRGSAVTYLMPPVPDESPEAVKTIVGTGSTPQGVTEDLPTARAAINQSRDQGAKL